MSREQTEQTATSPIDGRQSPAVAVPVETLRALRLCLVNCDSEMSAQAHGRPASSKQDLSSMSDACRQLEREVQKLLASIAPPLPPPQNPPKGLYPTEVG